MSNKLKVQEPDSETQKILDGMIKGMINKTRVETTLPLSESLFLTPFIKKEDRPCARFGDTGYLLPASFQDDADNIKNMTVRSDDVWVTTFPRSGTTWTLDLVWLLLNDLNFEAALKIPLHRRRLFLETKHIMADVVDMEKHDPVLRERVSDLPSYEYHFYDAIINAPSPRFIHSHLPFSLLPSNLLDTAKVIYVARDPRDVAVSYWHLIKLRYKYTGDFKTYWNHFMNNLVLWSPCLLHLKEAWTLRYHPNILFIFYEDMTKDLPSSITRISDFLGKEVRSDQMVKLCEHLDIKNFRKNESVNPNWINNINPDAQAFVRKGKSGAWRDHFDEKMAAQAQRWMHDTLAGTDLRFPDYITNKKAISVPALR